MHTLLAEATSFPEYIMTVIEHLHENNTFNVGLMIIFGLIGGKLIEKLKFPKVTGYILMGIIIGPSVLGLLSDETV